MQIKEECIASVLEIKHTLVDITKDAEFTNQDINIVRTMIMACNTYLDSVRPNSIPHLIYKSHGEWADASFAKAMKDFRATFKQAIERIEARHHISFHETISIEY